MAAAYKSKNREPWRYQLRDTGGCPAGAVCDNGQTSVPRGTVEGNVSVEDADLIVLLTDSDQGDAQIGQRGGPRRIVSERGSLSPSVAFAPDTKPETEVYGQRVSNGPPGDPRLVIVSNIQPGRVGIPCTFNIDAVRAGSGGLEIVVAVVGHTIPNYVKTLTRGLYEVSFTPQSADVHVIEVTFNGNNVPGKG